MSLPEGLSQELSMTRRRQTKQTGVLAYPHFLFAVVTQATDARGCDARETTTRSQWRDGTIVRTRK